MLPFENILLNIKSPIGCFGTIFCEESAEFFPKVAELFGATCRKPGLTWQQWLTKITERKDLLPGIPYCIKHVTFSHFSTNSAKNFPRL
jgi:hypothetical protein